MNKIYLTYFFSTKVFTISLKRIVIQKIQVKSKKMKKRYNELKGNYEFFWMIQKLKYLNFFLNSNQIIYMEWKIYSGI